MRSLRVCYGVRPPLRLLHRHSPRVVRFEPLQCPLRLARRVLHQHRSRFPQRFFPLLRRGVARFVGVVCIALVMEGLIMAIKYSQLDLAGNLNYAVAIVVSAAESTLGASRASRRWRAMTGSAQPTGREAHRKCAGGH